MTAGSLLDVCRRARPELACLGELARPLLAVVEVVERLGAQRGCDALADPGFALDVLTTVNGSGDAATVGRVLDFLRVRAEGGGPVGRRSDSPPGDSCRTPSSCTRPARWR